MNSDNNKKLTHVAGTFLIQADGAFLNGAGIDRNREDKNTSIPKSYRDGVGNRVPYVSAQAWRRWLRNTFIEETGWPASELRAIDLSKKGTTNKIAGELNPVEFPEDDIFGYMWATKGQGREGGLTTDDVDKSDEEFNPGRVKALMRSSPFVTSLLVSIRRKGWEGVDKGFVHLKEGTPLPYNTEFFNTHLQGVFCLDYSRLGVFWNLGDRIEIDEEKAANFLSQGKIRVIRDEGKLGKVYEMTDAAERRKERAAALFRSLAILRGGAKQAQFGTDIAPKILVLAGLTCGNPIFNHLFKDDNDGPVFKIETFKEVIMDYADRITTPILIGIRSGYLKNEADVRSLNGWYQVVVDSSDLNIAKLDGPFQEKNKEGHSIEIKVVTPIEVARGIGELLL